MQNLQDAASALSGVSQEDAFEIDKHGEGESVFERVGEAAFVKLSIAFYDRVYADEDAHFRHPGREGCRRALVIHLRAPSSTFVTSATLQPPCTLSKGTNSSAWSWSLSMGLASPARALGEAAGPRTGSPSARSWSSQALALVLRAAASFLLVLPACSVCTAGAPSPRVRCSGCCCPAAAALLRSCAALLRLLCCAAPAARALRRASGFPIRARRLRPAPRRFPHPAPRRLSCSRTPASRRFSRPAPWRSYCSRRPVVPTSPGASRSLVREKRCRSTGFQHVIRSRLRKTRANLAAYLVGGTC